ncbi:hypothetical protein D6D01_02750 [Aureobasidium pullulans]|uniref:Uncharacterized protein n=1 Tax=Aureobasidium pullulans TaxID=5580 RepID=A0A4S9LRT6_AURPU|nr:hypothetical protein D6D01_02750 [Aureobasidium pullulans]
MLRTSSVRDASTCLRCNLRLVLRQIQQRRYQSSDESPLPLRHAQFPAPALEEQQNDQTSRLRVVRTHANHGRIRGKKGGQRRVESSEALSIASLGQSSEVIVLRDLHEPKSTRKPLREQLREQEADSDEPTPLALTASDIQAMSGGRRAVRPPPSEVFESIEALRPDGGIHVVTKNEFDARLTALAKGYTISQLRGYLYHQTAPAKSAMSKAKRSRHAQNPLDTTEISSTQGELQDLTRTPWHPGITAATKRLPITRSAMDSQFAKGRKMNNKEYVIESILREAWALGIEEEQAVKGEMEFLLSPMQFGLLLTKNSEALRPLLESSKFYKNSRFQLFQPDHVIRIIGPRAEAEAIAFVLAEAFAPARSAEIALDTFHSVLQHNPPGYRLPDVFNATQLSNIMDLTKTYIRYDHEAKTLQIASFADVGINDAHRLLVALLPLHTHGTTTRLHDPYESGDCHLEPTSTTANLPSSARHRRLARWVTSSPRTVKTKTSAVDDPMSLGLQEGNARSRPLANPSASRKPLSKHSSIITQAIEIMRTSPLIPDPLLDPRRPSIWPDTPRHDFWMARFGQALHDTGLEDTYPGADGITSTRSTVQESYAKPVFGPKFPGLEGLLADSRPVSRKKDQRWVDRTELIAHLIPSPLEQTGILATGAFPSIQLRFTIEESVYPIEDEKAIFTMLPNGKRIVFNNIRAIARTDVVQLDLPSHPVDIRFERTQELKSRHAANDARIKSFIEAVHESMVNDTALRAPPAVEIPIPQWIVSPMNTDHPEYLQHAARSLKSQAFSEGVPADLMIPVKYLFAGFEYREPRDFETNSVASKYRTRVQTVEAGVTGGRRVELSMLLSYRAMKNMFDGQQFSDLEGFASASVDLVNSLGKIKKRSDYGSASRRSALAQDGHQMRQEKKTKREPRRLQAELAQTDGSRTEDSPVTPQSNIHVDNMEPGAQSEDVTDVRIPQSQVSDTVEALEMDKVAQQEQGSKLDIDNDPRAEGLPSNEQPSQEPIVIGEPEKRFIPDAQDLQPAERRTESSSKTATQPEIVDSSTEQDQTSKPAGGEESSTVEPTTSSSKPAIEAKTVEQTSEQTLKQMPEPEAEAKKEEEQTPEEEPLSVRLRRLMGR